MNILIRFEDEYGCHSLFNESFGYSAGNKIFKSFVIDPSLGNSGVFNGIDKIDSKYDKIILIFDLDNMNTSGVANDVVLNRNEILGHLRLSNVLNSNDELDSKYKDKLVFIPVEFCYETVYLYVDELVDLIKNIDKYDKKYKNLGRTNQNIDAIKMLKSYFDYSILSPEYFDGASHVAEDIHREISRITKQSQSDEVWKAQRIHLQFSRNLLTTYFRENGFKLKSDDICEKHESKLFNYMKKENTPLQVEDIIRQFSAKAVVNKLFAKLLNFSCLSDFNEVCAEGTLQNALDLIDKYNAIVKKPFDYTEVNKYKNLQNSIRACKNNIEIMLDYGVESIKKIKNEQLSLGFTPEIIDRAIIELSVERYNAEKAQDKKSQNTTN